MNAVRFMKPLGALTLIAALCACERSTHEVLEDARGNFRHSYSADLQQLETLTLGPQLLGGVNVDAKPSI